MKIKLAIMGLYGVLLFFLATACTGKGNPPAAASGAEAHSYSGPAWHALALLKTGENPLWFELGPDGPGLVESPSVSSLSPFVPWPHARYVTGMLPWNGFLVMAVNRDGFLVLGQAGDTESGDAILYRAAAAGGFWDPYTAESFFIWDDKPAVLLYRNDFFTEPDVPRPEPQVYVLDISNPVPLGSKVPALENFPPGGAWEAELVRKGPDGLWYFRMKEKGGTQSKTAYFRAGDLREEGTEISVGEWRNSNRPEDPQNIPPHLQAIINTAATKLDLEEAPAVRAISPDFEGSRLFAGAAPGETPALLYAYCSQTLTLAILPDGRGLFPGRKEPGSVSFLLPALPEGFSYTGLALLGNVLAATWEEQQEAGIGAAGFMVMSLAGKY